tara:strand:+ start:255 stop:866 length:612 start_codon:yes stop_codon:yes gene_type:complete
MNIARRFAGYLPVVVDCETGGVNPHTDALLEIAAMTLCFDEDKLLQQDVCLHYHVEAFQGSRISEESLQVTQIKPDHPFRFALTEEACLIELTDKIKSLCKQHKARRAMLVGHNIHFDLAFLLAAYERCGMRDQFPFHHFVVLDTVTLSAFFLRETVLARAVRRAGLNFDVEQAHSALYDVERTAALFCHFVNRNQTKRHATE